MIVDARKLEQDLTAGLIVAPRSVRRKLLSLCRMALEHRRSKGHASFASAATPGRVSASSLRPEGIVRLVPSVAFTMVWRRCGKNYGKNELARPRGRNQARGRHL
jgi:hypothetical protein